MRRRLSSRLSVSLAAAVLATSLPYLLERFRFDSPALAWPLIPGLWLAALFERAGFAFFDDSGDLTTVAVIISLAGSFATWFILTAIVWPWMKRLRS